MECEVKILFSKRKLYNDIVSGEVYYFHLHSDKICNDLMEMGLLSDKSLTITFPLIPDKYVRHFIRGCWDGDGSVYLENTKYKKRINASFVSGSGSFVETIVGVLTKEGLNRVKIYKSIRSSNPSYYFKIRTASECKKLFNYLYDGVSPDQYLLRKYDIFYNYFF